MDLAVRILEETKYGCNFCRVEFPKKYLLNKHLKMHTKPYKCLVHMPRAVPDLCPKGFSNSRDLKRHRDTTHGRVNEGYPCPNCSKKLARPDYIPRHLKRGACKSTKGSRNASHGDRD
ncbi:hypothetical protein BDP55DRAFT_104356 [Colletotrichum godetiae]|uniref:C2H2-type domain-containing protein n=1 Tax=Colletotrichum godetiae TaxID=1209918 RepID=A0AAJ0APW9_9PEZI|nr:uncharacterized protein BDP55DRAFT_104356 [Colletotrichum godetiae]KAK1676423.1 hypothetical protein BDP55DRAFT_104356 [Colletotrichum godetiae]